jgi:hypothetical protein
MLLFKQDSFPDPPGSVAVLDDFVLWHSKQRVRVRASQPTIWSPRPKCGTRPFPLTRRKFTWDLRFHVICVKICAGGGTCLGSTSEKRFLSWGGGASPTGAVGQPFADALRKLPEPQKRLSSGAPNILSICASNAPESIVTLPRRPTDKGRRLTHATIDRSRITRPRLQRSTRVRRRALEGRGRDRSRPLCAAQRTLGVSVAYDPDCMRSGGCGRIRRES